jgi:hypothetical protein
MGGELVRGRPHLRNARFSLLKMKMKTPRIERSSGEIFYIELERSRA